MIWNSQIDADLLLIGIELLGERNRMRSAVRIGNIEDESVRKDAGCPGDAEISSSKGFMVNLQFGETPRLKCKRFELKTQRVLEKAILRLEMLGLKKVPFIQITGCNCFICKLTVAQDTIRGLSW